MDLAQLTELNEDQAREYLEHLRWPDGPICPHCGGDQITKLNGKAHRVGVFKCRDNACRKQFSVTVGTIFHRSHIPLRKWIMGFHLICASKKGISALQLQRMLGFKSYKTAWHMAHRVRYAMQNEPLRTMLGTDGGIVESDETWVGPRRRTPGGPNYWQDNKTPVVALIERGGNMRTRVPQKITHDTLRDALDDMVSKDAELHTDGFGPYKRIGKSFRKHESVDHTKGEYARKSDSGVSVHCNSAESYFALLKRGIHGTFHHVGTRHLHRYADEFAFRWNHRKTTDHERMEVALRQAPGARLLYQHTPADRC